VITGTVSAWLGGSSKPRAVVRLVIGGALALFATWLIGTLLGNSGVVAAALRAAGVG
jgi:VIT1/CCC1 family predicted Fe2+/Mn2+ transporter